MTMSPPARPLLLCAAGAWSIGALAYVSLEAVAAAAFPQHSYAENWISDLGIPYPAVVADRVIDSPHALAMNLGFVVHGVMFLLAGVLVSLAAAKEQAGRVLRRWVVGLATVHAVGIVLVGVFHSGPVERADGTIVLHQIGALGAIVGGNLAVIAAGALLVRLGGPPWFARASAGLGVLGIVCFTMLLVDSGLDLGLLPPGVWERAAVYTVTVWQFGAAVVVCGFVSRTRTSLHP